MKFLADLHIHSHFSRATSKKLTPEFLDYFAGVKGIKIVGTGDFTHPGWLNELKEKTIATENGLLELKKEKQVKPFTQNHTKFLLSAEISSIYKKNGKVRKVHNVILVPGFREAEKINQRLINLGANLSSDGRPILGLASRDLLEIVLECGENNYFIPAHIWTPWFSMLGSKSGFNSIEECFEDLSPHIHTIETGLSTDPPMNWLCSILDKVTLVSNSDAHSPDKLGRNANIFNTTIDYFSLINALKTGDENKFLGTIDMFPQEGKYHFDGHRKCAVCWNPATTLKNNGICPKCKKPVTVGVMNRVIQLSDRENYSERKNRLPFYSIIPLKEIVAEINSLGVGSKKVEHEYQKIIDKLGPELPILLDVPIHEIKGKTSVIFAEAIRRMRNREIIIQEGYDGEFGVIKVFQPGEIKQLEASHALFSFQAIAPPEKHSFIDFDLSGVQQLLKQKNNIEKNHSENSIEKPTPEKPIFFNDLNQEQFSAVQFSGNHSIISAGPGTGKTKTLSSKMAWLLANRIANSEEILAITFTNKAAREIKERVRQVIKSKVTAEKIAVHTFHSFGLNILKKHARVFNRNKNFLIVDEEFKFELIKRLNSGKKTEAKKTAQTISAIKQNRLEKTEMFLRYEKELEKLNAFDFDDLIEKPLHLLLTQPEMAKKIKEPFKTIFVDEFQDTNSLQFFLLNELISGTNIELCLVGDINQSIYGFRGANPGFIQQFQKENQGTKEFVLSQSYRCSQTILSASAHVLDKTSGFLQGLTGGVKINISEQATDASEAEFIARKIVDLLGGVSFFSIDSSVAKGDKTNEIKSLSDFAILCRTKAQFSAISKALGNHQVPFQQIGTTPFYREKPFSEFIFLLNAVQNNSFQHAKSILQLKNLIISETEFNEIQKEYRTNKLIRFLEILKNRFFSEQVFDENKWKKLLWLAERNNNLNEFLYEIQLSSGIDNYDQKLEAVAVLTLHASKGLEFECVFIPGCENGILPYNLYKKEVDVDEEKRLLYVGMTRARKFLYLTFAKKRSLRGRIFRFQKSEFLHRIQNELIEKEKNSAQKRDIKKNNQLSLFN